jgi:hypothetical protein
VVETPYLGCWEWTGLRFAGNRHLAVIIGDEIHSARIVAWVARNGPVAAGWVVEQACGSLDCLNPQHLAIRPTKAKHKLPAATAAAKALGSKCA